MGDEAAHRHPGEGVEQRQHRVEDPAADILEIDVDAIRAGGRELLAEVGGAVVEGGVEAELFRQRPHLGGAAGDADSPRPAQLCDLADGRADGAGGGGHHHGLARLRLADVAEADIGGEARLVHHLADRPVQEGRRDTVGMHRGHAVDRHAAVLAHGAKADQLDLLLVATSRRYLDVEPAVHLAADVEIGLLGDDDLDAVGFGSGNDRQVGLAAFTAIQRRSVAVTEVVAMDMAEQHAVDLAEPRVVRPLHGTARIVKQPRSVRILEDHSAVEDAEFALMAAERGNLDVLCRGRSCSHYRHADGSHGGRGRESLQHGWSSLYWNSVLIIHSGFIANRWRGKPGQTSQYRDGGYSGKSSSWMRRAGAAPSAKSTMA